ncbi:mTERF domain-containing protein [Cephalotus follicularis]|uniref:mTERF domain-containing protein n=1 Tax=Cephalotus follicularis TaxID=3775 RepID=A0A1Q3AYY7_CEPFO|nr:mTERF domain-containing protein [Cephalotus follicularis]
MSAIFRLFFYKSNANSLGVLQSTTQLQLGAFRFHSFTVSYLKNSCGLSLETAKSLSKKIQFETPEKPDTVLKLLKDQGFNDAHISKIVRSRPELLSYNAQKTVLPKFEFFHSMGVSSADIVAMFYGNPYLFCKSLERNIIPCYQYLKSLLIVDKKVVQTFKFSRRSIFDPRMNLAPNLALLKEFGVPQSSISLMVPNYPDVAWLKPSRFTEIVKEVKQMGFDPSKSVFVKAIAVLACTTKSTLESRFEVYGEWGWSRDESLSAFKKVPHCMNTSNEKITRVMNFFVNKMGWPSQILARHPIVISLSFEKRIFPRCNVAQVLLLKGLIQRDYSICTLLIPAEKTFLKNYVTKYQESVPQLLDLYKGKVNLHDLGVNTIGNI